VLQDIRQLPKSIQQLIGRALKDRLSIDPLSYGKPLRYSWKGHRSLRVSDYRIIYRVEKDKVLVIIAKVDIRRDIYEI
jgi:addiction module RelE/StbE family toxin